MLELYEINFCELLRETNAQKKHESVCGTTKFDFGISQSEEL